MSIVDILLCLIGILFSIYVSVQGFRFEVFGSSYRFYAYKSIGSSPRSIDFLVSAMIAGSFSLSQILPFFGN